jgi:DNA-directed RNA polymerase subunit RPC12/RpoP
VIAAFRHLRCWILGHAPLVLDRRDWTIRCPRCGHGVMRMRP